MASDTILQRSAHSLKMKLAVMVEEVVRRQRNGSRDLDWEVRKEVMPKWVRKLRRSGYGPKFRHQVIKAACDGWKKMCTYEDSQVRTKLTDDLKKV